MLAMLAMMFVFGGFITNAKADCPCWVAEYDENNDWVYFWFCLPEKENPHNGDYTAWVWDVVYLDWEAMELSVNTIVPCNTGCILYEGDMYWDYYPTRPLVWFIWDNIEEEQVGTYVTIPPC